jgi:aspartyl-tRNA(Asn)/glutamyl-tRNA(Gln) amidotransferase subunit A
LPEEKLTSGELYELGVREIASAIASGEATPAQIAEAFLNRIAAVEPRVQAWSYLDPAEVRAQAAALTSEAAAGRMRGPLHGVPVGIKDEFHVKGAPTGMRGKGTTALETEDATCVERLRAAGAIIMGKTWMPVDGVNPPTRNPWNLEHTAGGSSSGSGAAVGAGMVPIAMAEQTGGSTLRPAAYCGIAALKPTYGRISRFGCFPFTWSFDHPGIIGRSLEDIALLLSVVAGPDPNDQTTLPEPAPSSDLAMHAFHPPRIGVVRNVYPERTQPAMQGAIDSSASRLTEAGATVVDAVLPKDFDLLWAVHRLVGGAEGTTFHSGRVDNDDFGGVKRFIIPGIIPATYYLQAQRLRRLLDNQTQAWLSAEAIDALLMPAVPGPAPEGIESTGPPDLLIPWSCLGYPAVSVNGGLSTEGLPLGLQLVAGPRMDYELMRVGAWCQGVLGPLPVLAL